jgi:hypothetical protein
MQKHRVMPVAISLVAMSLVAAIASVAHAEPTNTVTDKPVHGEYIDWRVLSVSHRLDKKYVRSIVGNDVAINAARAGKTQPWPDGSVLAKLSWKEETHPNWPQAVVPGAFVNAEAMIKDSKKFAETGGWGFGHWEGKSLVMYDKDKSAACFACHMPMQAHDYVYTQPHLQ